MLCGSLGTGALGGAPSVPSVDPSSPALTSSPATRAGLGSPASLVGRQGPCPAPDFSEGMTNICVKGNKGRTMPGRISKSHRDADVQTLGPSITLFWLGLLTRELLVSVHLRPLDWAHIAMLGCYKGAGGSNSGPPA